MGFSRHKYQSGLPCPTPGDLPNLEIEPVSLTSLALAGRFFTTSATWEAQVSNLHYYMEPAIIVNMGLIYNTFKKLMEMKMKVSFEFVHESKQGMAHFGAPLTL